MLEFPNFVFFFSASTSIQDFAIRVGLNPDIVQFFQKDLEIYTSENYPFEKTMKQARAEVILARALDKLGLLDLKLRRRSSSKSRMKFYSPVSSLSEPNKDRFMNNRYGEDRVNYDSRYRNSHNRNDLDMNNYYNRKNTNYNRNNAREMQNSYDYYNRNYDNRYVQHNSKNRQLQRYYNRKLTNKDKDKPPKFQGFEQEMTGKLAQSGAEDSFDGTSGDQSSDTRNEFKATVPQHLTYKWNTKPKQTNKSPYLYYG